MSKPRLKLTRANMAANNTAAPLGDMANKLLSGSRRIDALMREAGHFVASRALICGENNR
jgi:hypothetical protein